MFRIDLGMQTRDLLTGFSGVVTGRADYLTGCHQYLVRPPSLKADGEPQTAEWFDDNRLVVEHGGELHDAAKAIQQAVSVESSLPGADLPAPTKS